MPKLSDWGELKESQNFRLTPTAKEGLKDLAQSLGVSTNELIERLGRGAKHEVMKKSLWGVLTGTIMQLQNRRAGEKLEKEKMHKFWTVQNGKLGTAHVNREGRLADFREGKIAPRSHKKNGKILVLAENNCAEPIEVEFKVLDGWFNPKDWNHQFSEAGTASKVALLFEGQEIQIEVTSSFEIHMEVSEEQKQLARDAFAERQKKEQQERETQNALTQAAKEEFEQMFVQTLTRQEKRWLLRFKSNPKKSRQELESAIRSRKGGEEFLRAEKLEKILDLVP